MQIFHSWDGRSCVYLRKILKQFENLFSATGLFVSLATAHVLFFHISCLLNCVVDEEL